MSGSIVIVAALVAAITSAAGATTMSAATSEYVWYVQGTRQWKGVETAKAASVETFLAAAKLAEKMARTHNASHKLMSNCAPDARVWAIGGIVGSQQHPGATCRVLFAAKKLWPQLAYSGTHIAAGVALSNDRRSVWCVHVVTNPTATGTSADTVATTHCEALRTWISHLPANQVDAVRRLSDLHDRRAGLTTTANDRNVARENETDVNADTIEQGKGEVDKRDNSSAAQSSHSSSKSGSDAEASMEPSSEPASSSSSHVFRNKSVVLDMGGGLTFNLQLNCQDGPCRYCQLPELTQCLSPQFSATLDGDVPTMR